MAITLGDNLDPAQHVDAVEHLSMETINNLLVKYVVDRQPLDPGSLWNGHVTLHFRTDAPIVSATVSVWKQKSEP